MSRTRAILTATLVAAALIACSKDPQKAKLEYFQSGQQYLKDGKVNEAIVQFRNAVQQDPRYGEARLALAQALQRSGDVRGAFGEFVRAADLLPQSAEAQLGAGRAQLAAGRFEDAKGLAEKALAIDPKNVEAHILEGSALSGLKQFDAAIAEVEAAIGLDPTRADSYGTLGVMQAAQGNTPEAETAFKQAVAVAPTASEPRVALAGFYLSTGQREAAETTLNEALANNPNDIMVNRGLVAVYMRTGQAAKAERPLKLIAEHTKDPNAMITLADYYRVVGRNDDALQTLTAAAAVDTRSFVTATSRKAAILRVQNKPAEAYAAIEQVLAKQPKDIAALALKAQYQMADGTLDAALATAQTLAKENPNTFQASYVLAQVYQRQGNIPEAMTAYTEALKLQPRNVPVQVELSRLSLASGKTNDALKYAQEAVTAGPTYPDAVLSLTRAQMATGNVGAAESTLKALASRYGNVALIHAQLGTLALLKKDTRGARASFERAMMLDPASLEALSGLVNLDLQERKAAEAKRRVDAALAKTPESSGVLMLAARVAAGTGDQGAAEKYLRRVLELDPGNLSAYGGLAQLFVAQRRLDAAIAEYEKAAARAPRDVGPPTLIGMLFEAQKNTAEAQKKYEQVLAINPSAPVAANNLAWIFADKGENLDQALQLAQTARTGLPESVEVADTLGWIYYKKGLYTQAIAALRDAVEKQPANADFSYHLGLAYARNGDNVKAKETLQAALKANPNAPLAGDAKSELARLGS